MPIRIGTQLGCHEITGLLGKAPLVRRIETTLARELVLWNHRGIAPISMGEDDLE
jgi:hypothetical protein